MTALQSCTLNGMIHVWRPCISSIISFLLVAAAIYFVVVVPMNHMIERRNRRLGINADVKEEAGEDPADRAADRNP